MYQEKGETMTPIRSIPAVLAVALWTAASSHAVADDLIIQGLNVARTITCDDRDVVIHGAANHLTLRGRCLQVSVDGTGHVIHVEGLGSADVTGVNNRLEWEHGLDGDQPKIEITGMGNSAGRAEAGAAPRRRATGKSDQDSVVVQGDSGRVVVGPNGISVENGSKGRREGKGGHTTDAAAEPAAPRALTIDEGDQQRAYDCAGGSATVESGENRLTLRRCPELTVNGADNRIVLVGPVRIIRLLGNDNTVEWSEGEGGKQPRVETEGSGNHVLRK
jgi:hypothetical protein